MKWKKQGFTLIELLVTVAVVGILAGIGVPAFTDFISSSRLASLTNELVANMQMTRSEAITRGSRVTLCQSSNGLTCTNSNDWEQGWLIFPDDNGNSSVDAGEEPLRVYRGRADQALTIRFVPTVGTVQSSISFVAGGFPQTILGSGQAGLFRLCDDRGVAEAQGVDLAPTGRIRATKDAARIAACP